MKLWNIKVYWWQMVPQHYYDCLNNELNNIIAVSYNCYFLATYLCWHIFTRMTSWVFLITVGLEAAPAAESRQSSAIAMSGDVGETSCCCSLAFFLTKKRGSNTATMSDDLFNEMLTFLQVIKPGMLPGHLEKVWLLHNAITGLGSRSKLPPRKARAYSQQEPTKFLES